MKKCVICESLIELGTHGHNAEPVAEGRCCDHCNWTEVVPARISRIAELGVDDLWAAAKHMGHFSDTQEAMDKHPCEECDCEDPTALEGLCCDKCTDDTQEAK
jgi:hypothetical protein